MIKQILNEQIIFFGLKIHQVFHNLFLISALIIFSIILIHIISKIMTKYSFKYSVTSLVCYLGFIAIIVFPYIKSYETNSAINYTKSIIELIDIHKTEKGFYPESLSEIDGTKLIQICYEKYGNGTVYSLYNFKNKNYYLLEINLQDLDWYTLVYNSRSSEIEFRD